MLTRKSQIDDYVSFALQTLLVDSDGKAQIDYTTFNYVAQSFSTSPTVATSTTSSFYLRRTKKPHKLRLPTHRRFRRSKANFTPDKPCCSGTESTWAS